MKRSLRVTQYPHWFGPPHSLLRKASSPRPCTMNSHESAMTNCSRKNRISECLRLVKVINESQVLVFFLMFVIKMFYVAHICKYKCGNWHFLLRTTQYAVLSSVHIVTSHLPTKSINRTRAFSKAKFCPCYHNLQTVYTAVHRSSRATSETLHPWQDLISKLGNFPRYSTERFVLCWEILLVRD